MHNQLPMANNAEYFQEVTHQGKTIKVGDTVLVSQTGQQKKVVVSRIVKKQNHYWVSYDGDKGICPWPLVRV
ncbi:MAG: hypothetical protein KDJ52_27775 [Anaerolineae bacterium]|nr:hypothetical protein [Anaerolineae bacterium]